MSNEIISRHADGTVIYFSDSSPDLIRQVRRNDLNYVEQWLQENKQYLIKVRQSGCYLELGKN